jgi:hypothetical protein
MVNHSWKQIYPRDCYRILLMISGETGISFPKVVNIIIREGLIRLSKVQETTSEARLLVKRPIESPKVTAPQDRKEQRLLEEKAKVFSMVLEQWKEHTSPQWRTRWIEEAQKYLGRVRNAELIIALQSEDDKT